MPPITIGTVVKLVIASLLVGLLLAGLNLTPQELLVSLWDKAKATFQLAVDNVGWAASYVLLGAVIVVPIWLVMYLSKALRNRR